MYPEESEGRVQWCTDQAAPTRRNPITQRVTPGLGSTDGAVDIEARWGLELVYEVLELVGALKSS